MIEPALFQVQILVDAMPFLRIQFTASKNVEARAGCEGYVCYDKSWSMRGKGIVDSVWEDTEAVIEDEDEKEDDASESAELNTCTNLKAVRVVFA